VAALISNRPEWLFACFAAARIGAVFCPLSTWSKRTELDYLLGHSDARVLIAMNRFLRQDYVADLRTLLPELGLAQGGRLRQGRYPNLEAVVFLEPTELAGAMSLAELEELGREVSDGELTAASARVRPDDLCYILYTSGSTAAPKGVMLQHYGIIENCFNIGERERLEPSDRVWFAVPLFWGTGASNVMPATYTHGACLVLQEYFDPGRALELLEQEQCTFGGGFGHMIRAMLDRPDFAGCDLTLLRKGLVGFSPEDKRVAIETFGLLRACSPYGLTEGYGNCCITDADDPLDVKLYTQGHPLPNWHFKVVDPETSQPLPRGKVGMVCIKGYTTVGYYKNEEETSTAYDGDGFFITGDLGQIDLDGRFRFHSRLKEMIKTGGINVSPLEVEHILAQHRGIRQAHVVGVPDPVKGELIVAFVEVAGEPLTEEEVRSYVKERAASYKVPHHVLFRTDAELPRLATGKVPKYRLREQALGELSAGNAP
jgi:fatty-acyl-CoA synthase